MATKFDSILEITPEKETWTICARVIRLWLVADFNMPKLPFSMELVLMDERGDKIHASVRRTLIYKWEKVLSEGLVYSFHNFGVAANGGSYRTTHHKYKLNLQFPTKIEKMDISSISSNVFDFASVGLIIRGCFDSDYLVDVIGLLTGVGTEREYERNGTRTKINVIALESYGNTIECTLFGSFVDEINTFLATGEIQNAVVVVQLGKVKSFQDKIHLQNCMNCTKLIFNLEIDEAVTLRASMTEIMESPTQGLTQLIDSQAVAQSEDFLEITPRKTIEGLKDCKEEGWYVVFATVKHIIDDEDWWYTACICNKAVYPDHKMFFCEKCNKHVMKVVPRYKIKVCVIDETDCETFVIFDRDARLLLNKSCADLFEAHDKNSGQGSCPKEISDLVEKSFLFKVEFKHAFSTKFEQSFVDGNSESACLEGGKQKLIESAETDLAQNMMPKFSSSVVDTESQCGEGEGCDLSKDEDELTPLNKRDYATQKKTTDLEIPLKKLLKKNIKKEKM